MAKQFLPQTIPTGEVPTVKLLHDVRGDFCFVGTVARAGVHKAYLNQYGAVTVLAENWHGLGVRPHEMEWVSGKPSHWCEGGRNTVYYIDPYEGDWTLDALKELEEAAELKPLFIPLLTEYYNQSLAGEKKEELRVYGPRWNESTCPVGRSVLLSKGYGKHARATSRIISFKKISATELSAKDQQAVIACFDTLDIEIAVIGLEMPVEVQNV